MFDRILQRMHNKIRTRQYVMTLHAEEEMDNDNLSIFDIERCILTGHIVERQRDHITDKWKYLIEGETVNGGTAVVVAKISVTSKLVIITVYAIA